MAKAMVKLRVFDPKRKYMPRKNMKHILYLANSPFTILFKNATHGLFGYFDGKPLENQNLSAIGNIARAKTEEGKVMFRLIISLSPEDAARLGYDKRETWEELIRAKMPDVSKTLDIPITSLNWASVFHKKPSNLHAHIIFWSDEKEIRRPFVEVALSNEIRHSITKSIYFDEINDLYNIKNDARQALLRNTDEFMAAFLNVSEISPDTTKPSFKGITADALNELTDDFIRLIQNLPESGRLYYKFLPKEVKHEIKEFVQKILLLNDDCKQEYDKFIQTSCDIAGYYSSSGLAVAIVNAEEDILSRMCNCILSCIKNNVLYNGKNEDPMNRNSIKHEVSQIVSEIYYLLLSRRNSQDYQFNHALKGATYSKQAKKEYAIRESQSTGLNWDQ